MQGNGHALFVPRYLRRGGSRLPMSSGPPTQTHTFGTPGFQPAMLRPPRPRRMSLSSETDSETGSTQLNAGVPTRRFSCAKKPCCASVAWVIVGCMLAAVGVSLVAYGAHRTSSASLPTVEWGVCEVVPMYAHSQDRAHVDAANAGDGAASPGLVASCTEYSGRELIPTVLSDVRAAAEHAGVASTAAMDGSNARGCCGDDATCRCCTLAPPPSPFPGARRGGFRAGFGPSAGRAQGCERGKREASARPRGAAAGVEGVRTGLATAS